VQHKLQHVLKMLRVHEYEGQRDRELLKKALDLREPERQIEVNQEMLKHAALRFSTQEHS